MRTATRSRRSLPDGSPLANRLLGALPARDYARVAQLLRMRTVAIGRTRQEPGVAAREVYFPNGGVFSVTNVMRSGAQVEIATVGCEGMLGVGVFLGDRIAAGRTFLQVPDGQLLSMAASAFVEESGVPGPFRDIISRYAQANLLQIMQGAASNALHDVRQRCCRWLLQTQDRVGSSDLLLKQDFLAMMLAVQRPTVTLVIGALHDDGLISSGYGRIRVLKRRKLEHAACECYGVVRAHFTRLGL